MIVKQILLVATLLIWCMEDMFILGFKDFFRNRKSVWQALVSLFFFARARPRNFSLRSWQKKKPAATFRDLRWSISKNSWLSSYEPLQQYFHMVLFILKDLLGNTLSIFFVDSWFYQQLRVKESTLDLQTSLEGKLLTCFWIRATHGHLWEYTQTHGAPEKRKRMTNRNQRQTS